MRGRAQHQRSELQQLEPLRAPVLQLGLFRHRALLRNRAGALPLRKDLKRILVVGPNASDIDVLVGNYNGTSSHPRTVLDGITAAVSSGTEVVFRMGSGLLNMDLSPREPILAKSGWRSPEHGEIAKEGPLPPEVKDLT